MRVERFLVKIEAGCYLAYFSDSSEPFGRIIKICSHRWRVSDFYQGYYFDFKSFNQCKAFLGID